MPTYSRFEVLLVNYPFSDLSGSKVRPAVVVSAPHSSQDLLIVPLTSRTSDLVAGEFVLSKWAQAGLNLETAVKRGIYKVQLTLVIKRVGKLEGEDIKGIERSIRDWLGFFSFLI